MLVMVMPVRQCEISLVTIMKCVQKLFTIVQEGIFVLYSLCVDAHQFFMNHKRSLNFGICLLLTIKWNIVTFDLDLGSVY